MKKYLYDDVYQETLKYFNGDTLATDVWINKYCLKDSDDNYYELTPDDMHKRLANEFYRIEQKYPNSLDYETIYNLLKDFKYIIPGGSPMSGIGNNLQMTSISNCFVIGNNVDSYGGICNADEQLVQLMKRRGGVGFDMSHLRPVGSKVNNSAGTSTGAVSFTERYSNSTKEVAQDGRRGALMLSLHIKHPDSERFIDAKLKEGKITSANISTKVTDEFMNCVIEDKPFIQQFPIDSNNPSFSKTIDAKQLWTKLMYNAWKSAEPGILFIDTIHKHGLSDIYEKYKTITTNPCVVGDTLVLTNVGWIKIKNLNKYKKKNIKIITQDKDNKLFMSDLTWVGCTQKNAEIYKVSFSNYESLLVNSEHKLYDQYFNQIKISELDCINNKIFVISGNELVQIMNIEKLQYKEDVYDLTAIPNYNFFGILNYAEYIIFDDIKINDNVVFKYFDVVNTTNGQKFAYQLENNDDII